MKIIVQCQECEHIMTKKPDNLEYSDEEYFQCNCCGKKVTVKFLGE